MANWTDAKLRSIKPKDMRQQFSLGRGLYFIVEPSGSKYWRYRYKIGAVESRMKLGDYPAMGLADAEKARNEKRIEASGARRGECPAPALKAKTEIANRLKEPTVSDLADEWLLRKKVKKTGQPLSERTVKERRYCLDHDIIPLIGVMKAVHVTHEHCRKIIDKVEARGSIGQAVHVHKALRAMFRYALGRRYLTASPMEGMESPAPYVPKDRNLSDIELQAFFEALKESDTSLMVRLCIEWQLLTASRPGEARLTTWGEINEAAATWTIPKERSKNRKPHVVYLSAEAMKIVEQAKALRQRGKNAPMFPGKIEGKPLSLLAIARAINRLQPAVTLKLRDLSKNDEAELAAFTPHDLRRTAATLVTKLGFSRFTAGLLLNHTDQSVTGIYDQNDYEAEKRKAWRMLGERVAEIKSGKGAKVVPINRKKSA